MANLRGVAQIEARDHPPALARGLADPVEFLHRRHGRDGLEVELHALCGTGIHTNAVDTLVADTPTGFTVMGWYLVNGSPSDLKNYL